MAEIYKECQTCGCLIPLQFLRQEGICPACRVGPKSFQEPDLIAIHPDEHEIAAKAIRTCTCSAGSLARDELAECGFNHPNSLVVCPDWCSENPVIQGRLCELWAKHEGDEQSFAGSPEVQAVMNEYSDWLADQ